MTEEPTPEPTPDTKKKTRKKKVTKKAAAKTTKEPVTFTPGCGFGAIGCGGERIVDWPRAVRIVRGMLKSGTLKLCDKHLEKLARKEAG